MMLDDKNTIEMENTNETLIEEKRFITLDLIKSQIGADEINEILSKINIEREEGSDEDENYDEYADDFAGDIGTIKGEVSLTEEDIEKIYGIVDEDLPDFNYELINEYISEDDLSGVSMLREDKNYDVSRHKYKVMALNTSNGKLVEKEYTIQRDDLEKYVYSDDSNVKRAIVFDWEKLFGIEGYNDKLEELNRGYLSSSIIDQKSYQSILDKIINDNNFILNEYPELALYIFKFRSRVATEGSNYNITNFLFDIAELINDNKLRSVVYMMEDSKYEISLDLASANNDSKIVEDLRVSDKCNKVMLKTAIMCRFLIPIINDYCKDLQMITGMSNDAFKYIYNHLNLIIFNYVMRYISLEFGVNAINKLFKIVNPRVKATKYVHSVIWRYLESFSMDEDTAVHKFMNKIVRTILPKIDVNRSAIGFLDVVVHNMIHSDFRYNFPHTRKRTSINSSDDDDTSELDKISVNVYLKENEAESIITRLSVQQLLMRYFKEYNIKDEDVRNVIHNLPLLNDFQMSIIKLFTDNKLSSIDACNYYQRVALLTVVYAQLRDRNLNVLADILLGRRIDEGASRGVTRISADIARSEAYKELKKHYTFLSEKFERDSHLFKLAGVASYKFETLDLFGDKEFKPVDELDKNNIHIELFEYANYCTSRNNPAFN